MGLTSVDGSSRACYHATMRGCGHLGPIILRNSVCHLVSPCNDGRASAVCINGSGSGTIMFTFSVRPHCTRGALPIHLRKLSTSGVCHIGRVGLVPKTGSSLSNGNRIFSKRFLVGMKLGLFAARRLGDHMIRMMTR